MEASSYRPARARPLTLASVLAVHAAAIAALMLAKMEMPERIIYPPLPTIFVPEPVDPPPVPPEPIESEVPPPRSSAVDRVPPKMKVERDTPLPTLPQVPLPMPKPGIGAGTGVPQPVPAPEPVRLEARIDSRSVLQPPYPASEERSGVEGSCACASPSAPTDE